MPGTSYLVAVLAIAFSITLALRAVPFAVLGRLRGSVIVRRLAGAWYALLAVAVTIGVHLAFGRRTILSVGAGTAVYVVLLNSL
ncbi:hypothetical protein EDD92_0823 [Streptomyces sp. TLI_185]|nr:hypothetical protein EDD92_0823 [Streptomyces sp. TLI_185]